MSSTVKKTEQYLPLLPRHLDGNFKTIHDRFFSTNLRWVVLFLCCTNMSCLHFVYDIPTAIQQQLQEYMPPNDEFESYFNLLYTFYSLPNIILPLFGGCLVDKLGASLCLFSTSIICFVGHTIFTFGVVSKSWSIMLFGRAFFGCGGEFCVVSVSSIIVRWFLGQELSLAFSLSTCIGLMGSTINAWVSPSVADYTSVPAANFVGVVISLASLLSSAFLYFFVEESENHGIIEKVLKPTLPIYGSLQNCDIEIKDEENIIVDRVIADPSKTEAPCKPDEKFRLLSFQPIFWTLSLSALLSYGIVMPFNNIASGLLLERNFFRDPPMHCSLKYPNQCTSGFLAKQSNPSLDENNDECLLDGSVAPLLPSSVNINQYNNTWKEKSYNIATISPKDIDCNDPFWSHACVEDYCRTLKRSTKKAVRFTSIPYLITAITLPIFGIIIDLIGCRGIIIFISFSMLAPVHLSLALTNISPFVPLIGQGVAYALLISSLWPSISLVVESDLTGLAYGIITSSYNLSLALFPLIIAKIYDTSEMKFLPGVEIFFILCAVLGVLVSFSTNMLDKRNGAKLN